MLKWFGNMCVSRFWCLSVCLSVCPSVCHVPQHNSRTDRPRNLAGWKPTSKRWIYLQVKRSKVKVTRRINAHTVYAQYLPNGKPQNDDYDCTWTYKFSQLLGLSGLWAAAPLASAPPYFLKSCSRSAPLTCSDSDGGRPPSPVNPPLGSESPAMIVAGDGVMHS